MTSVSGHCFLLMPYRKDSQGVLINTVANDVAAISEFNEPFPVLLGQVLDKASHVRMHAEGSHSFEDRFASSLGGRWVFRPQEIPEPLKVADRGRREDHLWHSGAGSSSSVPQVESHFSTSSPVRWRPVA